MLHDKYPTKVDINLKIRYSPMLMATAQEAKLQPGDSVIAVWAHMREGKGQVSVPLVPDPLSFIQQAIFHASQQRAVRYDAQAILVRKHTGNGIEGILLASTAHSDEDDIGNKITIHSDFNQFLGDKNDPLRQTLAREGIHIFPIYPVRSKNELGHPVGVTIINLHRKSHTA